MHLVALQERGGTRVGKAVKKEEMLCINKKEGKTVLEFLSLSLRAMRKMYNV